MAGCLKCGQPTPMFSTGRARRHCFGCIPRGWYKPGRELCSVGGCGHGVQRLGFCPMHLSRWQKYGDAGAPQSSWSGRPPKIYSTPAWRVLRLEILARDQWFCQIGMTGCRERADRVDHIVELADGGAPLDPANLQASCAPCNTAKWNRRTAARARAARVMARG